MNDSHINILTYNVYLILLIYGLPGEYHQYGIIMGI